MNEKILKEIIELNEDTCNEASIKEWASWYEGEEGWGYDDYSDYSDYSDSSK